MIAIRAKLFGYVNKIQATQEMTGQAVIKKWFVKVHVGNLGIYSMKCKSYP